jgi:hypothetical protein
MDLPTSWQMVEMSGNDLTSGILRAVNAMLIDILATMARQVMKPAVNASTGDRESKNRQVYIREKRKIWKPVKWYVKCWHRTLNQLT